MRKYHFIYKTTNLINNKIYIGKHSTDNLDDGYLGSGVLLTKAIKKYGKDNFIREILSFHDTSENALLAETEIVDNEFVTRDDTYNLMIGGKGGNTETYPLKGKVTVYDENGDIFIINVDDENWLSGKYTHTSRGRKMSDESKKKLSNSRKGIKFSNEHIENIRKASIGRKLSKESRKLISKPIIQMSLDGEYIKEWSSSMDVERELSINHSSITQCCKGNRNSAGKFKWEYKE